MPRRTSSGASSPTASPVSSRATRWAGVPLDTRRSERRAELVDAAFDLFGTDGEAAVSVRAVCRACGLNTRYFYESFRDTDELLGAVYDKVALELASRVVDELTEAGDDRPERLRAGIYRVLEFSSADPRRGRILFTEARANPVLAERRALAQTALMEEVLREESEQAPDGDPLELTVRAAMFTGAMVELAQQWLTGRLGTDLHTVVDQALPPSLFLTGPSSPGHSTRSR